MRAAIWRSADALSVVSLPSPSPGAESNELKPDEVVIRVRAFALNPVDYKLTLRPFRLFTHPQIGRDFSGTVVAVGAGGAKLLKPNDRVMGIASDMRAGAEFVKVNACNCVKKPECLSFEEAAGVGVAYITGMYGLLPAGGAPTGGGKQKLSATTWLHRRAAAGVAGFRARGLGPGDKLLVVGASGGTGIAACQIARSVGAEVFAICSAKNVDFVVEKLAVNRARVFDYTMHREDQANFTESKQDDCQRLLSAFREKFGRDPEDVSEFVRHFIDDIYAGTPAGPGDAPGEITEATLLSHLAKVDRIFASLSFRGWLVDLNKTQFVAREATLLGHTVADGISAGQRHKLQMQGLQEPKSVDDVVSYRCMGVWLRQFYPFFGALVLPLNAYGRKGRSFAEYQQDPDAKKAMQYLREAISNLELHAPRVGWSFHLLCDASDVCGAFWLIQTDPTGAAPPIVIFLDCLTFKAYELFWTTTEKEFRAVEFALCSCKPTIGGERVFVHHDHKDSDSIKERVERDLASRRILKKGHRMALNIYQTFGRNFTMTWRPGHELIAPDFLSRQFPGAHDAKCAFERQFLSASPIRELVLQLYRVELPKQFLVDLESFGTAHKQRIAAARRGGAPARDLKPKTKPDVVARDETATAIQPRPQQGSTAGRDTSVAVLASLSFSAASSVLPDFPTEFPTLVLEDPDDTVVVPIAVTIAKRAAAQGRLPKKAIPGKVKVRAWSDNRGEGCALSSDKEFESRDGSARRELWLSSRVLGAQRAIEYVRFAAKGSIAEQDAFAFTTIKKDEAVYPDDAPFFFAKPTAAPVVQPKSKAKGK
eukprot:g20207.t1